jgi:hypothetical protein
VGATATLKNNMTPTTPARMSKEIIEIQLKIHGEARYKNAASGLKRQAAVGCQGLS